ncbi:SusC/RagA family TonB-linked outer membrane protein [Gemmatimonas sp.]|uniref:SusC/RagA family TonB-linked outer membrane protein n=1 Tax=Gemmatimonas sp. TaxID=1962908 RepID=UPI003983C51A
MRLFGPVATDRDEQRSCSSHHSVFRRPLAAVCARLALLTGLVGASLLAAPRVDAQAAGGTISGRVTDAATGNPVAQVRVLVAGTQNGTLTADNGRYTLRVTTVGSVTLDVNRIGYEAQKITVNVTAAAPSVADVQIKQAAFSLAAVVTTVTGQQRKVELANATAQINVAEKLAELPVSNMGSLLSGRTSSVQVVQTGATGTGSRIRIRGQNSFSLSNDPIVVIDGVRATSTTNNGLGVGGSGPSRLDDINPSEIETIEIVKGPSAATLYGTEAANGVVVITTKRGKSGKTVYNLSIENGQINNTAKYPDLWSLWGRTAAAPTRSVPCLLTAVASGACTSTDSLSRGNVLNIPGLTPIGDGSRRQYNLQASGGNDKVQFFVSGQTEGETGIYKMPDNEVTRLKARRGVSELPSNIMRPNALARNSFRANVNAELRKGLFVQASSGYVNSELRLPQNEDNGNGLMVDALGGPWRGDLVDAQGDSLRGYRSFMMGDVLAQTTTQGLNRFINTVSAQWTPTTWLSTRGAIGSDYTSRNDLFLAKVGEGPATGTTRQGNITSQRLDINQQTADYGATGTFQLLDWMKSTTSIGMQYVRNAVGSTVGTGISLPPGGVTVSSAATRSSTQSIVERRTLGYYVEQQIALRDRLFITGGMRRDAASAFGANTRAVYYPKLGASWLISDETFLPLPDFVNSLRLRGTYGASGQIPGATDAVRFYSPGPLTTATGDAPAASLGSLGNTNLKPEFSAETEFGFDLNMFSGGTNIEVTSYSKSTTDALIQRSIAPSLSGLTTQFVNIGNIKNSGLELTWNQRLLERDAAALSFTLTGSTNKNRMTKLGQGVSPIASGNRNTQRNLPGYPLFGLWDRTISFDDKNGDGIIVFNSNKALSELTFSDTAVYQGNTFPTREIAFSPTLELFKKKLKVSGQVDSKWGFRKFNNTLRHQCMNGVTCRGRYDKSASLQEQANALATSQAVYTGMFENGAFTRFRELSVAYEMPTKWANAVRASRWSVVLTGRNLGVITDYTGVDPEAAQSNNDARGNEEYFSTPPLRIMTLRMNFSF